MELVTTVMVLLMLKPKVLGGSSYLVLLFVRGCSSFVLSFHVEHTMVLDQEGHMSSKAFTELLLIDRIW